MKWAGSCCPLWVFSLRTNAAQPAVGPDCQFGGFVLGWQTYLFHRFPVFEPIERTASAGRGNLSQRKPWMCAVASSLELSSAGIFTRLVQRWIRLLLQRWSTIGSSSFLFLHPDMPTDFLDRKEASILKQLVDGDPLWANVKGDDGRNAQRPLFNHPGLQRKGASKRVLDNGDWERAKLQ